MGFYDRLEEMSDRIDEEMSYRKYRLRYYLLRDYTLILLFGREKLNDALAEYVCYSDMTGVNEAEEACFRAAESKAIELINQHKFWWMKEFKVKEKS